MTSNAYGLAGLVLPWVAGCAHAPSIAPRCPENRVLREGVNWEMYTRKIPAKEPFRLLAVEGTPTRARFLHHEVDWVEYDGNLRWAVAPPDASYIVPRDDGGVRWIGGHGFNADSLQRYGFDHPIPDETWVPRDESGGGPELWGWGAKPSPHIGFSVDTEQDFCLWWDVALPSAPLLPVAKRYGWYDHVVMLAAAKGGFEVLHIETDGARHGPTFVESLPVPLHHLKGVNPDSLDPMPGATSASFGIDQAGVLHYSFVGYPNDAVDTASLFQVELGPKPKYTVEPIGNEDFVVARTAWSVGYEPGALGPYVTWLALDRRGLLHFQMLGTDQPIRVCGLHDLAPGAPFLSREGALAWQSLDGHIFVGVKDPVGDSSSGVSDCVPYYVLDPHKPPLVPFG